MCDITRSFFLYAEKLRKGASKVVTKGRVRVQQETLGITRNSRCRSPGTVRVMMMMRMIVMMRMMLKWQFPSQSARRDVPTAVTLMRNICTLPTHPLDWF